MMTQAITPPLSVLLITPERAEIMSEAQYVFNKISKEFISISPL